MLVIYWQLKLNFWCDIKDDYLISIYENYGNTFYYAILIVYKYLFLYYNLEHCFFFFFKIICLYFSRYQLLEFWEYGELKNSYLKWMLVLHSHILSFCQLWLFVYSFVYSISCSYFFSSVDFGYVCWVWVYTSAGSIVLLQWDMHLWTGLDIIVLVGVIWPSIFDCIICIIM